MKISSQRRLMPLVFPFALFVVMAGIVFAASGSTQSIAAKKGTISGKIMMKNGGPLSGGQVQFFNAASGPPPSPDKYDRAPDSMLDMADDGTFSAELLPGKYYLGALKRKSDDLIGPPQEGDFVFRSVDKKGAFIKYTVRPGRKTDVGTLSGAAPLSPDKAAAHIASTAVEGVVIDMDGTPVSEAVVVAFINPTLKGKPLFVSDKTGKDGKYVLRLSRGTYFLRARNTFASGPPEPGQIVGYYGEGAPAPITINTGEIIKGVDFKVILFPGRGPFSGQGPAGQ